MVVARDIGIVSCIRIARKPRTVYEPVRTLVCVTPWTENESCDSVAHPTDLKIQTGSTHVLNDKTNKSGSHSLDNNPRVLAGQALHPRYKCIL